MEVEQTIDDRLAQLGIKVASENLPQGNSKKNYDVPLFDNKPTEEVLEALRELKREKGSGFSVNLRNPHGGSSWIPESLLTKIENRQEIPPENAAEALMKAIDTHSWEKEFKGGIVSAEVEIFKYAKKLD